MMTETTFPTLSDIRAAHERIRPFIHRTPVVTCQSLNKLAGAELFFKCENFQKVGAFKFRGASNAVRLLTQERGRAGVCTHSSGNHAQALALAARQCGYAAYIVMPENSPSVKVQAVRGYGAQITFCKPTLQAREDTLQEVVRQTGATFIHPYNNADIIAGQGTAAVELLEEVPELDVVMAPVGGGGLLSGTALAVHFLSPQTRVIAAEPVNADDAARSLHAGRLIPSENPQTIADGLRTSLGSLTFPIIRQHVSDILTVSEAGIVQALRATWERAKILIEPSSAVPLGALIEQGEALRGLRIGVILSGGNIDLDALPW